MKFFLGTLSAASLALVSLSPTPVLAQGGAAADLIEEIVVTGRKREELLIDVPVSISVITAETLVEQGIYSPQDIFDATVGLTFDETSNGRNFTNPGIRGVQSELPVANLQKVNNFIDGMPMLGSAGSLSTFGLNRIEVYRGPQSAAFGRSTFVGAINYVTVDATEEFNGMVQTRYSDQGNREISASITGPLGDKLGYVASFLTTEWGGPDDWTSTDGFEMGSEKTDQFMGKLNFEFTDSIYGEIMYTKHDTDDNPAGDFTMAPGTCVGDADIWKFDRGVEVRLQSGAWDCDPSVPAAGVPRNHDVLGQFLAQYDANIADYEASIPPPLFPILDTNGDGILQSNEYLAQQTQRPDVGTFEQALQGQTIFDPFTRIERDRIQGELNFVIGDSLLQFMGMYNDETLDVFRDRGSDSLAVFGMGRLGRNVGTQFVIEGDEEQYAEVRWISPAENRLRYTLSGSYYNYEFNGQSYTNGGAIFYGLTTPGGSPVDPLPRTNVSENANNLGASLSLQYDLNDRVTLSFEGRYQVDEVCGLDLGGAAIEFCVETTAFLPRLAATSTVGENHNVYVQASVGNNPAGVTVGFQDPAVIEALDVASGRIVSPPAAAPNDGILYDGSDGVHFPSVAYDATTFDSYEEETLYNFEIGSKGAFAQGRVSYAAALYYMVWDDMLGSQSLDWDDTTPNGWNADPGWSNATDMRTWLNRGDGEFYGIEFTADYAVGDIWTVGGYLTLSRSIYDEFCSIDAPLYWDAPGGAMGGGNNLVPILSPGAGDDVITTCGVVNGNDIPRQSDVTGNLNLTATLPNDFLGLRTSFRADVRYTGPYFADDLNVEERSALAIINLSANLRNQNWTVRLYVNNVTDENEPTNLRSPGSYYTDNANPTIAPSQVGGWSVFSRRPREAGVLVGYHF